MPRQEVELIRSLRQKEEEEPSLSRNDAQWLYVAKCADQAVPPLPDLDERFVSFTKMQCTDNVFDLKDKNLGPNAAEVLAVVLSETKAHVTMCDLTNNKIEDRGAIALAEMLKNNTSLTSLVLRSAHIGADGAVALMNALHENHTLTNLDLSGTAGVGRNFVGQKGAAAASKVLASCPVLYSLSLRFNGIGDEGTALICEGLGYNESLHKLDLAGNNITTASAPCLEKALMQPFVALQVVDLSHNRIGNRGAKAIASVLEKNETLIALNLADNDIEAKGAFGLGDALALNTSLHSLNLDQNNIRLGFAGLAYGFAHNLTLRNISLSQNSIEFRLKAVKDVCKTIKESKSLTSLRLCNNKLGSEGMSMIARAVEHNTTLQHLDMSNNNITDEAGDDLAQLIRNNTGLTSLSVRSNKLEVHGEAIARAVSVNSTLHKCLLDRNYLDYAHVRAVQRCTEDNKRTFIESNVSRCESKLADLKTLGLDERVEDVEADLGDETAIRDEIADEFAMLDAQLVRVLEMSAVRKEELSKKLEEERMKAKQAEADNAIMDRKLKKTADEAEFKIKSMNSKVKKTRDACQLLSSEHKRRNLHLHRMKDKSEKTIAEINERLNAELAHVAELEAVVARFDADIAALSSRLHIEDEALNEGDQPDTFLQPGSTHDESVKTTAPASPAAGKNNPPAKKRKKTSSTTAKSRGKSNGSPGKKTARKSNGAASPNKAERTTGKPAVRSKGKKKKKKGKTKTKQMGKEAKNS